MREVMRADGAQAAPAQATAPPPPPEGAPLALTPRALVLGSLIGAVMCLSNLYLGLKIAFTFPVALIACVVGLGTWRALTKVLGAAPGLSLAETSAMQSTASSAGYSTGGTIFSASVAWLLLAGQHPPGWTLFLWTLLISALGVCFAVPLQRAFLHRDALAFPSGVAAATAARALHSGDEAGRQSARALSLGVLVASVVTLGRVKGMPLASLPFELELSLLGAGALVGPRIGASLIASKLLCSGFPSSWLQAGAPPVNAALGKGPDWSQFPGTALMTGASLTHLLLHRGVLSRSFSALLSRRTPTQHGSPEREVPRVWWVGGLALLSVATVALGAHSFGVPVYMGLLGVVLSFALAVVGCRITGETDTTLSGPLAQVAQLVFGVVMPGNPLANTAAAGLAGSTAASSSDLLTDVKAGSILGAHPRQTFLAQLFGCVVGSAVIVPVFLLLVPDASVITPERFPAPGGEFIAGPARVLAMGMSALPEALRWVLLLGVVAGVAFALLERRAPERLRRFMPSAIGLGLAFMVPLSFCVYLLLGSLGAALLKRFKPTYALTAVAPLAAGLMTGESLVRLAVMLLGVG